MLVTRELRLYDHLTKYVLYEHCSIHRSPQLPSLIGSHLLVSHHSPPQTIKCTSYMIMVPSESTNKGSPISVQRLKIHEPSMLQSWGLFIVRPTDFPRLLFRFHSRNRSLAWYNTTRIQRVYLVQNSRCILTISKLQVP